MRTSDREVYGATMLTLRTAIGLTRGELAKRLGVSRQTVREWETGRSYPKVQHLKGVIALAVEHQTFPVGHEVEEIQALWKVAHQKVPLDEHWLSALLSQRPPPRLHLVPKPRARRKRRDRMEGSCAPPSLYQSGDVPLPPQGVPVVSVEESVPVVVHPGPRPRIDWGDAQAIPLFYGREQELSLLMQWVVQEHCRVISVLGMGGIGKSALAVSLMYQLVEDFEVVIFRSLRDAPSCDALLDECLQVLSPQSLGQVQEGTAVGTCRNCGLSLHACTCSPLQSASFEQRVSLLLSHLRRNRVLVVLDNLESLLEAGDVKGHLRPGFEGYGLLLHRVVERDHQSCLLITSRERPAELRLLEGRYSSVRSLRLTGLDVASCQQILEEKGVVTRLTPMVGTEADVVRLINIYGGNPLALKIVAETIIDLFAGEIGLFLVEGTVTFGSITVLLSEQLARLSALEQTVLCWLAIAREPMTLDELLQVLVTPLPRVQVLEAVDSLHRRSLIERGKRAGSFTLQSVVLEYVTAFLITEGSCEIKQGLLDRLIQYSLSQATAREYARQTQERLLLSPLLAELQNAIGDVDVGTGLASPVPVEEQLLSLLNKLRGLTDSAQGYGPANLIMLLRLLRGNLNGLDLSHLCIRGAYLQNVEMQGASLAFALIHDTTFAEAVGATWCVAISQDGRLWAAGGMQGVVRVWREEGKTLHLIWQAHTDVVQSLAFSPDGRMLASGSIIDDSVKLWDMESGALLWVDWRHDPHTLAFSPDSSLLACSGMGVTVRLWDTKTGTALQNLEHPSHVFTVAWSPDGSLLASSCADGQLRLWERQEARPGVCVEHLQLSTSWEASPAWNLAFAPDGRTLASVGLDREVKLWEVETCRDNALRLSEASSRGRLLHTFEGKTGKTNRTNRVVWSPDGRTLAICSYERAIRIFDVEQRRHRATLSGHTSDVNGLAFTPDGSHLLSGSADSTLRVWDVESYQCVRVMQGYAVSLYDLDWSPDGTHLVSGGADGVVTIWDIRAEVPPRELRGHSRVVSGVGWSPDGRWVASSGWDTVMRLWNPTSGACGRIFQDPSTTLLGMAWSPDGNLLAVATFLRGMYVWDVTEGLRHWIGEADQTGFLSAAWSPDGSLLAGGSDDGGVYLWERADGRRRHKLLGHYGDVKSLAWSPDGKLLASGSGSRGNGELFVWDVQTWRDESASLGSTRCLSLPMQIEASHPDMVNAVAWRRSRTGARMEGCKTPPYNPYGSCGDQLISGGSDGRLCWWDVKQGVCVGTWDAHQGAIRSLKVSPDGKLLASCGDDGTIRLWDLASCTEASDTGGRPRMIPLAPPLLRTLRRDRPYERLNITGIRGLTEAQKSSLRALGAIEDPL
jgi:WD40 repeat protein/transcriptional regulator with XRE-family HTH domain